MPRVSTTIKTIGTASTIPIRRFQKTIKNQSMQTETEEQIDTALPSRRGGPEVATLAPFVTQADWHADIDARLKRAFSDAFNAIPDRPEFKSWKFLSVCHAVSGSAVGNPSLTLNGEKEVSFTAESFPELVALVGEYDPEAARCQQIAKAENELARLQRELAELKGGAQ